MATIPEDKASGEQLSAVEVNKLRDTGYVIDLDAGETIDGATLPVAVYIDDTTNEVYACDGNDQDKLEFIGFAISNSTDGNPIQIQNNGIVAGFTGLDIGKKYYVQDDQTIGTTIGTYEVLVGIAISATQILIMIGEFEYMGSASDSADAITVPVGARFAIVSISTTNGVTSSQNEVLLTKTGKAVGSFYDSGIVANSHSGTATWAGNTITLTWGANDTSASGTAYFYR